MCVWSFSPLWVFFSSWWGSSSRFRLVPTCSSGSVIPGMFPALWLSLLPPSVWFCAGWYEGESAGGPQRGLHQQKLAATSIAGAVAVPGPMCFRRSAASPWPRPPWRCSSSRTPIGKCRLSSTDTGVLCSRRAERTRRRCCSGSSEPKSEAPSGSASWSTWHNGSWALPTGRSTVRGGSTTRTGGETRRTGSWTNLGRRSGTTGS
mmetsp:Transcript_17386/g.40818  ORF Transcript_17386/g.40818 Transcript_17386/m.40818 type:complete len:205 (+) Transcript_17386:978-1592(+)